MVVLSIILDQSSATYIAGEKVTGRVNVLVTGRPLKCRGVRIHFYGEGLTRFKKGNTIYKTTAPYFDDTMTLWGNPPGQDAQNPGLHVGAHSFPFSYDIPAGCPSSYQDNLSFFSDDAHIKYTCKAIIDRAWQLDETTTNELKVIGQNKSLLSFFNDVLHLTPAMREETKAKTLGLLCCESGQISATIRVPANCYRAGDKIPFYAEIDNESSREILRLYVCLKRTTTLWAACGEKDTSRTTLHDTMVSHDELIKPGGSKSWQGQLQIPSQGIPVLGGSCSIISIEYKIVLSVVPKGPYFNLDLPMVIEMGTPVRTRLKSAE